VCVHRDTQEPASTPAAVGIGAKINSICEKAPVSRVAAATAAPILFKRALRGRAINVGAPRRSPGANQGRARASHANFSALSSQSYYSFFTSPALIFQQRRRSLVRYLAVLQMPKGHTLTALPGLPGCLRR
jgi:hypothetical protein